MSRDPTFRNAAFPRNAGVCSTRRGEIPCTEARTQQVWGPSKPSGIICIQAPGYEETWGRVLPGRPSRALPPSVLGALPPFSPPAPPGPSRPALRGRPGPLSLGLRLPPAVGERRAQTTPLASRPAWGLPPSRARTLHPAPPGSPRPGGAGRGQSPPPALRLLRLRPAAPLPSPPRPAPPWQSLAPRPCDPAAGPGRDGTRWDRRRGVAGAARGGGGGRMERRWVFVVLDVLCVLVGKSRGDPCVGGGPRPASRAIRAAGPRGLVCGGGSGRPPGGGGPPRTARAPGCLACALPAPRFLPAVPGPRARGIRKPPTRGCTRLRPRPARPVIHEGGGRGLGRGADRPGGPPPPVPGSTSPAGTQLVGGRRTPFSGGGGKERKSGPPATRAPGALGGARQTCRAGLRARLGEGAARGPLPAPPPGSREQRPSVCPGAVRTMAPEFYPLHPAPRPPRPQMGFLLSAGVGGVILGGLQRPSPPPERQNPIPDPFGVGWLAAGRSAWGRLPALAVIY